MGFMWISLLAIIFGISGCASSLGARKVAPDERQVKTFADIYRQSKHADKTSAINVPALSLNAPEGYVKPYIPVIRPPQVIKVWVPSHVLKDDKSIMVAGHWSFVMLEETKWFIEGEVR